MDSMSHILIIEDDPSLVELLRYNLENEGFEVSIARDGEEGLESIATHAPDLVVLDWMLPNVSGIEVCRQLRQKSETRSMPVIMLTAKGEESDRLRGLETGADDYIVKPFSPAELTARIKAVLRRAHPEQAGDTLEYADIEMDLVSHRVSRSGTAIKLGPTEFRLLHSFLEKPGRVFSREQLLDKVWGRDIYVELRTVDVHIRRLRKALNTENETDLIRTVRSAGYSLDAEKF